ncbi:MAG: hypothetical protein MJY59_00425 [Bacteroidaceae bacterium]|nr:hypothetical protein [Bacteroidaceae bacterium]
MRKLATALMLSAVWMAPCVLRAQNISQIAESDPLIISGAVGTQNTFHYTSGTDYASPLSNTIYANLNISVYGFTMPFSLYYANNNTDFNYPHLSFNLNPSYKQWTGHFGESNMAFSNYVMNMSFNGAGLEYNDGKRWRASAFYGRIRKAVNDDPTDPLARSPQYKRMGWGFKAGYGSGRNYVDIYFLRAYDCLNSINDEWRDKLKAQENMVVGVKGCISPLKWLSLTANAAGSIFNTDATAEKVDVRNDFDKIFDIRYSTLARFAGDMNVNLSLRNFNTSLSYRFIQPDYTSLGLYSINNNYHSLGISASTTLFRKIALSGTFNGQEDNLTNKQLYTTKGYIYAVNTSVPLASNMGVTIGYNGYTQDQGDGTAIVTDSSRIHRQMNSFSISPYYSLDGNTLGHTFGVSGNYVENKDLNKYADGKSDVSTLALGASYNMDVKPWEVNLNLSYSHQQSDGYNTRYSSDVLTFTTGRSFLEDKNLNISASVNLAYNEVKRQSKNLSIGGSVSAGYTLGKVHQFSAAASFNKYGDVNMTKKRSSLDVTDISCSLNYTYTFSIVAIKSRKHRMEEKSKSEELMRQEAMETLHDNVDTRL